MQELSFQAEALAEERKYVELLRELRLQRAAKNTATKEDARLSGQLKQWMQLNGRDELCDDERGIRAHFQDRVTTDWDIRGLARNNPQALIELAAEGYLSGNTTLIDVARKSAPSSLLDELQRYRVPNVSTALMVEETART